MRQFILGCGGSLWDVVALLGMCQFILGCGNSIWDVVAYSGICQFILGCDAHHGHGGLLWDETAQLLTLRWIASSWEFVAHGGMCQCSIHLWMWCLDIGCCGSIWDVCSFFDVVAQSGMCQLILRYVSLSWGVVAQYGMYQFIPGCVSSILDVAQTRDRP
jgi:hypothetical protein